MGERRKPMEMAIGGAEAQLPRVAKYLRARTISKQAVDTWGVVCSNCGGTTATPVVVCSYRVTWHPGKEWAPPRRSVPPALLFRPDGCGAALEALSCGCGAALQQHYRSDLHCMAALQAEAAEEEERLHKDCLHLVEVPFTHSWEYS